MKLLRVFLAFAMCACGGGSTLARPPSEPSPAPPASPGAATDPVAPASAVAAPVAPHTRPTNGPLVRVTKWQCDEQECEGYPSYAYDYLPAVSADNQYVAIVEERDGWQHTREVGVRIVSTLTETPVAFLPLVTGARNMGVKENAHRRKHEFQALVDDANDKLNTYSFRPLFPAKSQSECGPEKPGAPKCVRHLVPELTIDVVSKDDSEPAMGGLAKVIIWQDGKIARRIPTDDWDPGGGCSKRGFHFIGARADARTAVFVSEIVMTGHNCDGHAEPQPWSVRVVRW